jgi:hypothetical protein
MVDRVEVFKISPYRCCRRPPADAPASSSASQRSPYADAGTTADLTSSDPNVRSFGTFVVGGHVEVIW